METHASFHLESLLQHGPRLRALARRLVRDEHAADDLVQETWARAVEHGPAGSPWRWLARVLGNLAIQERRLGAARAERERAVARVESGDDGRQRLAMHRELVAAIEGLEEPYRQTILLRYFDGLPPRRIATRLGVPAKTVKTRLHRGIGLLRATLDRHHGGRERWLPALLPLARMGPLGPLLSAPLATTGAALKLATLGVAASVGLYLAWPRTQDVGNPAPGARVAEVPTPSRTPATMASPQREDARAAALASRAGDATAVKAPSGGSQPVAFGTGRRSGRVFGPSGTGLADLRLVLLADGFQDLQSGADGVFEFTDPVHAGTLVARDPRYTTVLAASVRPGRFDELALVVVAPAVTLAGVAWLDGDPATPAADAEIRIEVPLSFRGRFPVALDRSATQGWHARTDAEGRFRLAGAPGIDCARLEVLAGGCGGSVPAPEAGSESLEIAVECAVESLALAEPTTVLTGEVRHADGRLAPWTLVAAGGFRTRADEDARFELRIPALSEAARAVVAVARGEQAACFTPATDEQGQELWPAFLALQLGPPPLALAGRVLARDGQPLAGAPVWIEDLTFVASEPHGFTTLEHRMLGLEERWFQARTEADGRFELGGLLARGYTLAALDPATLQIVRAGPIEAGARDVELAFSSEGLWARVAGRVLDRLGSPLEGLTVQALVRSFEVRSPSGDVWYGTERRPSLLTDAEGRFELADLPREGVCFQVEQFPGFERRLDPGEDPLALVLEVPRLCHLQIELAPGAPPDGCLAILDADGNALDFFVFGGGSTWGRDAIRLGNPDEFKGGSTPVLSVPDVAAAVVLTDGQGIELRRVTVALGEELVRLRL